MATGHSRSALCQPVGTDSSDHVAKIIPTERMRQLVVEAEGGTVCQAGRTRETSNIPE